MNTCTLRTHTIKTCVENILDYVLKFLLTILDAIVNIIEQGWGRGDLYDHLITYKIFTFTMTPVIFEDRIVSKVAMT